MKQTEGGGRNKLSAQDGTQKQNSSHTVKSDRPIVHMVTNLWSILAVHEGDPAAPAGPPLL